MPANTGVSSAGRESRAAAVTAAPSQAIPAAAQDAVAAVHSGYRVWHGFDLAGPMSMLGEVSPCRAATCRRTILARGVRSMTDGRVRRGHARQSRHKFIILTVSAGLVLIMLSQAGVASAAKTPSAGKTAACRAQRRGDGADTGYRTGSLSPATYPSWAGRFYSVSATSADDVWAVGLSAAGGQIAHWDGNSWADSDFSDGYQAVAAQSPTDVWAVGGTSWFYPTQTLARRWNGQSWTQVPTPTPGGSAWFNAVGATSPTNGWAVGCMCGGPGDLGYATPADRALERQGLDAAVLPVADAHRPVSSAWLRSVPQECLGGRRDWQQRCLTARLIEHWNGYRWRRVTTPPGLGFLQGVAATKWNNVWAVGYNNTGPGER